MALLCFGSATRAAAQEVEAPAPLQEVDPDAASRADVPEPEGEAAAEPASEAPRESRTREAPAAQPAAAAEAAAAPSGRPAPPPIVAPRVGDAQLTAAWTRVQAAREPAAMESALRALVALREDVGASDLEPFALALSRLAEQRARAGDEASALQLAEGAVSLAPDLPYVHFALARSNARRAPLDVVLYAPQAMAGLRALAADPRYLRPALADVGGAGLLALLAAASAVVLLLFLRGLRYLLHDVHHLFPRSTARWQSAALALLLLGLPAAFRLGWVPLLLALFAAVALYLTRAERLLGAALLALLGLLPLAAGELARETAFAGTVAEDVYVLERGGLAAAAAGARVQARDEALRAQFAELFALGRYEARRGELTRATAHFKRAAALRSADPRVLTNLGNIRLASGDPEAAAQLYESARQEDATLAAAAFNVAQVYQRRAALLPDFQVGETAGRASAALTAAERLDPSLLGRVPPPGERLLMNRLLLSPGLTQAELLALTGPDAGAAVRAQLEQALLGGWGGPFASVLPAAAAALVLLWASAGERLRASRGCERCGRSVCRRCDRALGVRGAQCSQCVNAFVRRGLVAPQVRARKELEVERHRTRMERLALAAGTLVGGAGHVLSGLPVRGALHAFLFLFLLLGVAGPQGLVRAPYGEVPAGLKVALLVLVLVPLHLLSLRSLRRRQQLRPAPETH
nr:MULTISPECIES: hypothetical protein [Myxococcaceae]